MRYTVEGQTKKEWRLLGKTNSIKEAERIRRDNLKKYGNYVHDGTKLERNF